MAKDSKLELAVISTEDLHGAGITAALTQNDLVEVVAHDIYNRYLTELNETIKRANDIKKEYKELLDPEITKMKTALKSHIKDSSVKVIPENENDYDYDEDDVSSEFTATFGKWGEYWPSISMSSLGIYEKDRGTFIDSGTHRFDLPNLKTKTSVKVELILSSGYQNKEEKVKIGTINGTVETRVLVKFQQIVTIPISRFKKFAEKVAAYNEEVKILLDFLPKNGALSVERFTREARVKLNKNILRQQTPEFKKKISQLFQIEL